MNNLDAIFVDIDDSYQTFLPAWKKHLISSSIKQKTGMRI
ncbi:Mobile element protein [Candidatus Enterovibrio escicola]|uniref:Mobile element protein n=1 Tax=Candidatus Enterovibrio escicola TaxID=1927127 RepID=A0A2A5T205_9GAMM|nr:Mobile element protein [Candidatus Enterovibrio escacola]